MKHAFIAATWLAFAPAMFVSSAQAETYHVTISNVAFNPTEIKAQAGDTIEWQNADIVDHTATAKDGSFDVKIAKGVTKSVTVSKTGAFEYYCRVHPNMKGKITIEKSSK